MVVQKPTQTKMVAAKDFQAYPFWEEMLGGSSLDGRKWLITMVHGDRFRPLRIGLWDPFQMEFPLLINGGYDHHLQVMGAHPPSNQRTSLGFSSVAAPDRVLHDS